MFRFIYYALFLIILIGCSSNKIVSTAPKAKNPVVYFKKQLRIVKKSISKNYFVDSEYSNAIRFLIKLTDIKTVCFDPELNIEAPCEKDIDYFESWFQKNRDKLIWDKTANTVKLKS